MRPLIAFLCLMITTAASAEDFYVGTYTRKNSASRGIYHGKFDSVTGKPGEITLAAEAPSPSFLARSADGKFLYAALEDDDRPAVGAFRIEADGRLAELNRMPSAGAHPCHVSLDREGKYLFVANYTGGSIAAFALEPDGSLGRRTAFVSFEGSGPDRSRQEAPHAHAMDTSPDNRFVYACDLGTDKIRIFKLDAKTGSLSPAEPSFSSAPAGAGPRHLIFSGDGKLAYVANEMGLGVTVFRRDESTGALEAIQTVAAHPKPPSAQATLAEIERHPTEKWIYVSSRADDTLSVFAVQSDGKLELVENLPAGVKIPRGFAIDPSGKWLLVAGQGDDSLRVFRIDPATGRLLATEESAAVGEPASVLFSK